MQIEGNRRAAASFAIGAWSGPAGWLCQAVVLLVFLTFGGGAATAQNGQRDPDRSIHDPALTNPPDANAQMQMREQKTKDQNYAAANAERKRQITDDSAKLLQLANELKLEVDKSTKDTLSITVIRKAMEIERLAHDVKEKMKLTVGSN